MSSEIKYSNYYSTQYGFSLEYPSKWGIKEHSAMFLASFQENVKDPLSPSINVTIQNLEGSLEPGHVMTPKQLLEISIQQIEQINAQKIETGSCKIGNDSADFLSYYAPEQKVRNKQCFFIKNNFVYIISYTAPNGKYTNYLSILDKVCLTFKHFEAKGYKYAQMESHTSSLVNSNNKIEVYYQYWVPKQWKQSKQPKQSNKQHQTQEYTDSSNNLSLKVEVYEKVVDKNGNGAAVVANGKQHHFNYSVTEEDVTLSMTFTCLEGEQLSWEPLYKRLVADCKVSTTFLESPVYDRFYNLIFQYYVHIPKTFSMDPRSSNFTSLIFIDQDCPQFPVFNITLEDLGVPISLEKYRDILLGFYKTSVENARITNEEHARLDNYRALRISMDGRDPEIDKNCKVIIQCAVVKRTKGLLLNVRLPTTAFDSALKRYFYIFYSLVFYQN